MREKVNGKKSGEKRWVKEKTCRKRTTREMKGKEDHRIS